jgi:hypothetical protein
MGCYITNATQVLMSDRQVDTQPKPAGQAVFSTTGKGPEAITASSAAISFFVMATLK